MLRPLQSLIMDGGRLGWDILVIGADTQQSRSCICFPVHYKDILCFLYVLLYFMHPSCMNSREPAECVLESVIFSCHFHSHSKLLPA